MQLDEIVLIFSGDPADRAVKRQVFLDRDDVEGIATAGVDLLVDLPQLLLIQRGAEVAEDVAVFQEGLLGPALQADHVDGMLVGGVDGAVGVEIDHAEIRRFQRGIQLLVGGNDLPVPLNECQLLGDGLGGHDRQAQRVVVALPPVARDRDRPEKSAAPHLMDRSP